MINKKSKPFILTLNTKNIIWIGILMGIYSLLVIPPISLYIFEFFMFIPFCYIYHPVNQHLNKKQVFLYGFLLGLFIMICNFYWITHTMVKFGNLPLIGASFVFLLYASYLAIKFGLIFLLPFILQKRYNYPSLPGLLISCFVIEALFPEIFPFYIGNPQNTHSYFVQIADIIGVQGISVLVLLVNYLLYRFLSTQNKKNLLFLSIIFFVTYSYSFLRNVEIQSYKAHHKYVTQMSVGVIQPNIPFGVTSLKDRIANKDRIIRQTNGLLEIDPKLDLIVWPESALPYYLQSGSLGQEISEYINNLPVPIMYNAPLTEDNGNEISAAIFKKPHSSNIEYYAKNMLMPFGEYLPTDALFPSLHKYFPEIGDFIAGTEQNNFMLKSDLILSPQICYEITSPSFTRKFISKGGDIVINLTNDSWFGDTRASLLHLWVASFRAIENRVPIVRATNTGISTILDIKGFPMTPMTELYTDTYFVQNIPIYLKIKAIYSYLGNWTLGIFFFYLFIRMFFTTATTKRPWFIKQIKKK